ATLFDYLPENTVTVTHGDTEAAIRRFAEDTQTRYAFLKSDRERPVLPPPALFLQTEDFFGHLKQFARLAFTDGAVDAAFAAPPDVAVHRQATDPISRLRALVDARSGESAARVLLCADSPGRRETIVQMLAEHDLHPSPVGSIQDFLNAGEGFAIGVAPLSSGFSLTHEAIVFLTENDLYPGHATHRSRRNRERTSNVEAMVRDLSELREGDPVVH